MQARLAPSQAHGVSRGMAIFTIENLRHDTRIVIPISYKGTLQRLLFLFIVLWISWTGGSRIGIAAVLFACLAAEGFAALVYRRFVAQGGQVTDADAFAMLATNVLSTASYCSPCILLVLSNNVPLIIAGFTWAFGINVYITNTYLALPIYNWAQMVPALGSLLLLGATAVLNHDAPSVPTTPWMWLGMTVGLASYSINTVQTILAQKDVQTALSSARAESAARLAALERINRTDAMTGLLNRPTFDRELAAALALGPRAWRPLAVFLMDLDGFKPVNDTYGHEAGDAVLREVGRRMQAFLTSADGEVHGLAARIGGDEFAMVLFGPSAVRTAAGVGQRLTEVIGRPIPYKDIVLRVGGSVGIAVVEDETSPVSVESICAQADQAMFRAKIARRQGEGDGVLVADGSVAPRPDIATLAPWLDLRGQVGGDARLAPVPPGATAAAEGSSPWAGSLKVQ